jgi:hypothetical protein
VEFYDYGRCANAYANADTDSYANADSYAGTNA